VPDSSDDETFFGLLDHPDRWIDVDQRTVESALTEQRQLLAACHTQDHQRRKSLASIVAQIEAALPGNRRELREKEHRCEIGDPHGKAWTLRR